MPDKPVKLPALTPKKMINKDVASADNETLSSADKLSNSEPSSLVVDYEELSEDVFISDELPEEIKKDTIESNAPEDKESITEDPSVTENSALPLNSLFDSFENLITAKDSLMSKFDGTSFSGDANEDVLRFKLLERSLQDEIKEFFHTIDQEVAPVSNTFLITPINIPKISLSK